VPRDPTTKTPDVLGALRRPKERERWLTKKEIAAEFRVSTRTVERQKWPCQPVGGQNRYLRSQVEAALSGVDGELPDNVIPLRPRRENEAA
jgi:hypothetical protein